MPFINDVALFSKIALCFMRTIIWLFVPFAAVAQPTTNAKPYLDVSISIFDANLPATEQEQKSLGIYPQVRAVETSYIPALLQAILLESDRWGAIRIIPMVDESAELMVSGKILKSDGLALQLEVLAQDSSGRIWFNKTYSTEVSEGVSLLENSFNIDPFQSLYTNVANDLLEYYEEITNTGVESLKLLSRLRFASLIAPDAFADYLVLSSENTYSYSHLPAENDPIFFRVKEIREHGYIFIDVVDRQYQDFVAEIKPVYDIWRDYKKDLVANASAFESRQGGGSEFRRGSYLALKDSYNNYRWQKMQGQFLQQLSVGFTNEVSDTELDLEDSIYRLTGTMSDQYQQWYEILRSLYELEVRD